jgi:hypothetical protein
MVIAQDKIEIMSNGALYYDTTRWKEDADCAGNFPIKFLYRIEI